MSEVTLQQFGGAYSTSSVLKRPARGYDSANAVSAFQQGAGIGVESRIMKVEKQSATSARRLPVTLALTFLGCVALTITAGIVVVLGFSGGSDVVAETGVVGFLVGLVGSAALGWFGEQRLGR